MSYPKTNAKCHKDQGNIPNLLRGCFAATSNEKSASLITGDPDFKLLDRDGKLNSLD